MIQRIYISILALALSLTAAAQATRTAPVTAATEADVTTMATAQDLSVNQFKITTASATHYYNASAVDSVTIDKPTGHVYVWKGGKRDSYRASAKQVQFIQASAVDLGLSVKWATCNLGATQPTESGDYYRWGATTPDGEEKDGINAGEALPARYDAATVNLGAPWRMPTKTEMEELVNNCEWNWTTRNDVNGYEIKGKNGNTIFLPAYQAYFSGILGSNGGYWTSTATTRNTQSAALEIRLYTKTHQVMNFLINSWSLLIRPVCP